MNKITILHFSPLEFYPPIQNLLRTLSDNRISALVLTTHSSNNNLSVYESPSDKIVIDRFGRIERGFLLRRYFNYLYFFFSSFLRLIIYRPDKILYFETISSFPAIIYKLFFRKSVKIFIHYHEYVSLFEYANSMRSVKGFHKLERYVLAKAEWVSQTNRYRMNLFEKDIAPLRLEHPQILPNYPPKKWLAEPKIKVTLPIKIIYAGALSLQTMYTRQFAQWVVQQQGKVIWDIYSYNYTSDAKVYLDQLNSSWIQQKRGVDYDALPQILIKYDVGVILYKGHIPNYVYNAPNKLFEYQVCGLDVWLPREMIGSHEFLTNGIYPKVSAFDFERLYEINIEQIVKKAGFTYREVNYFSEIALQELIERLTQND